MLTGVNGTIIEIPAHAFIGEDGQPPSGTVELTFADFYEKSDFVLNHLSTQTVEGRLLQKAGIDREETFYTLKAKETQTKKVKICDVISSKCARKTAVSYAASMGFNEIEIGRFTAHTSNVIRHYLNIFSDQLDIMVDAISKDVNK